MLDKRLILLDDPANAGNVIREDGSFTFTVDSEIEKNHFSSQF